MAGAQPTESLVQAAEPPAPWSAGTRVAFRFSFVYFGLYIILTQMLTSLLFSATNDFGAFEMDETRPAQAIIVWLARHVFRVAPPIITTETGSGDRMYDWVEFAAIVAIAIVATGIWCVVAKRRNYARLYAWFRVVVRFSLAATLLTYGASKAIPLQMPFPYLARLLEPYGNFSPMGVLWSSIGASPAYEIFTGCAEILGGILLILPATTPLGALIGLADSFQVFMLNMTYDVPVKLLAFHMILLSLFLLAPDCRRLASVLLFDRGASAPWRPPLFRGARANRIAIALQVIFGLWLIGANLYGSFAEAKVYGSRAPRSPLYGIWTVEDFTLDGQPHPPLMTDSARWRRVVFDAPEYMQVQAMGEPFRYYGAKLDMNARTLALSKFDDKKWQANFSFAQPQPGKMSLDGAMDGHRIHAALQQFDRSKLMLVSRGFHWIQDYPFNR